MRAVLVGQARAGACVLPVRKFNCKLYLLVVAFSHKNVHVSAMPTLRV